MDGFDVIVIGTGVAGQTVAEDCAAAGLSVAAVDRRPFGGTCLLRGCHPKKVLVGVAEAVERARDLQGDGVTGRLTLDWPALIAFKRTFTQEAAASVERTYADAGIVVAPRPCALHGRPDARCRRPGLRGRRDRGGLRRGARPARHAGRGAPHGQRGVHGGAGASGADRLRRRRLHQLRVRTRRACRGVRGHDRAPERPRAQGVRRRPRRLARRPLPRARHPRAARLARLADRAEGRGPRRRRGRGGAVVRHGRARRGQGSGARRPGPPRGRGRLQRSRRRRRRVDAQHEQPGRVRRGRRLGRRPAADAGRRPAGEGGGCQHHRARQCDLRRHGHPLGRVRGSAARAPSG